MSPHKNTTIATLAGTLKIRDLLIINNNSVFLENVGSLVSISSIHLFEINFRLINSETSASDF